MPDTLRTNERQLLPALSLLAGKITSGDVLLDKSGVKVAEVLGLKVELDPAQHGLAFPGRETDQAYVAKELRWYLSRDLSIRGWVDDVKIWQQVAGTNGRVNSNYGALVYGAENGCQLDRAVRALWEHKDTRQALIIYQRPTMHDDWCADGKHDFVCTNFQHLFIRGDRLHCVTSMRSQDAWFGLFNDVPWFHHVIGDALARLRPLYRDLQLGTHIYQVSSFHVYERHFAKLRTLVKLAGAAYA